MIGSITPAPTTPTGGQPSSSKYREDRGHVRSRLPPWRRADTATGRASDRASSSASQAQLDAGRCAVVACRPSSRSCRAECCAATAAVAPSGAPVQAGSAASTATVRSGCRNAQATATAAPIDTPPTAIGPPRGGVVQVLQVAVDQTGRLRPRRYQVGAGVAHRCTECPGDVIVVRPRAGQHHDAHVREGR